MKVNFNTVRHAAEGRTLSARGGEDGCPNCFRKSLPGLATRRPLRPARQPNWLSSGKAPGTPSGIVFPGHRLYCGESGRALDEGPCWHGQCPESPLDADGEPVMDWGGPGHFRMEGCQARPAYSLCLKSWRSCGNARVPTVFGRTASKVLEIFEPPCGRVVIKAC